MFLQKIFFQKFCTNVFSKKSSFKLLNSNCFQVIKISALGGGGGLVDSVLAFYSDNQVCIPHESIVFISQQ